VLQAVAELTQRARRRPVSLRARGALRALLGDPEGGRQDLEEVQVRFPDDVRTRVALAFALRGLGDEAAARGLLERAAAQAPDYPFAHLDLAALALRHEEPEVALEHARQAQRLLPLEPLAYTLAGAALLEQGHMRQALSELGRALALAPVDPSGHVLPLAMRAFLLAGDPESVRLFLRGGVPLEPELLYGVAWRYLRDSHVPAAGRSVDWMEWKHRFQGQLSDSVDAHAAIGRLAASLDDAYTRLMNRDDSLDRLLATGEVLATEPDTDDGSRSLYWHVQEEGRVYLRLTSLRDPTAARAVEQVLESLPAVEEVVLDLRGNPGGYEDQARAIADLLLPEGREAAAWRTRAGPGGGAGRLGAGGAAAVEILVDQDTGSAAEHLAEELEQGGARVLGGPTRGKQVAQFPYILPDGWTLLVTAARRETGEPEETTAPAAPAADGEFDSR
jgi:tetratricopeptide (TPR) repeat protein